MCIVRPALLIPPTAQSADRQTRSLSVAPCRQYPSLVRRRYREQQAFIGQAFIGSHRVNAWTCDKPQRFSSVFLFPLLVLWRSRKELWHTYSFRLNTLLLFLGTEHLFCFKISFNIEHTGGDLFVSNIFGPLRSYELAIPYIIWYFASCSIALSKCLYVFRGGGGSGNRRNSTQGLMQLPEYAGTRTAIDNS
jgi:hypothetical protein